MKISAIPINSAVASPVSVTACSSAGRLSALIIQPDWRSAAPPLIAIHGISRNSDVLAQLFAPYAHFTGRPAIVPHFHERDWPTFQRPCKTARPDRALLELLNQLEQQLPDLTGPVDVFGHSGGAQLAHRVAMLFPHRVSALHLAAAGWYCLPDRSMPYPYGLAVGDSATKKKWVRRKEAGLDAFLRLPLTVYVGTHDTERDMSLRQKALLDRHQGRTRLERAQHYVKAVQTAAGAAGHVSRARLIEMPGCVHDVEQAITKYGLAARVMGVQHDETPIQQPLKETFHDSHLELTPHS